MPFAGWIIFLFGGAALYAAIKGENVVDVLKHAVNPKGFATPTSFLSSASGTPTVTDGGAVTSPSGYANNSTVGGAASAVTFAEAQLGKPYEWGAAGPDRYDCSGLVMQAWKAGGVNLVHHAASQYVMTSDKSLPIQKGNNYPAGSLVFFGPSLVGIDHVGIVIGPDLMIEAPHTGDVVKQYSISSEGLPLVAVTDPGAING